MAEKTLTCDKIGDLDNGRARAVINECLRKVIDDLDDRGDDEKPRTVTITLSWLKKGGLVINDVQAATKMPAYRTNNTVMKLEDKPAKNGELFRQFIFQDLNAENPNQPTFEEMDADEQE